MRERGDCNRCKEPGRLGLYEVEYGGVARRAWLCAPCAWHVRTMDDRTLNEVDEP